MKNKFVLLGICAFLAVMGTALAGEISGKWIVTVDNVDVEMNFKVDGDTLTGTVYNPLRGEMKIEEGRSRGDNISFIVTPKLGKNEVRIYWKGQLDGNVLRMTRVLPGGRSSQFVGVRDKKADK